MHNNKFWHLSHCNSRIVLEKKKKNKNSSFTHQYMLKMTLKQLKLFKKKKRKPVTNTLSVSSTHYILSNNLALSWLSDRLKKVGNRSIALEELDYYQNVSNVIVKSDSFFSCCLFLLHLLQQTVCLKKVKNIEFKWVNILQKKKKPLKYFMLAEERK